MPTTSANPNATVSVSDWSVVGEASAHEALAADSDSSYVTSTVNGATIQCGLEDLSLPSGARIVRVEILARCLGAFTQLKAELVGVSPPVSGAVALGTLGLYTVAVTNTNDITESEFNAATLKLTNVGEGGLQVYRAYARILYLNKPTLTIDAPTGTITDDDTPTVEWTPTSSDAPQAAYEVKIMADGDDPDADTPVAESGVQSGDATSWAPGDPLPDGDYDVYVKIAVNTNGELFWSDWVGGTFTLDIDKPAAPTLTLSPEADHIEITLSANSGDATTDRFQVQRKVGDDWVNVYTKDGEGSVDNDSGAVVKDYEAPAGVSTTYRARAIHDFPGTGASSKSAWVEDSETWASVNQWISNPQATEETIKIPVVFISQPGYQRPARQAVHEPLDRPDPIVISMGRGSRRGEITIMLDEDDFEGFDELLAAGPVLIQSPADQKWGDRWVTLGDEEATRYLDKGWTEEGMRSFSWTEVPRPEA